MFDGKATPSSAINLSQFVIQWCTNFLFVWCFRKFLSIPFICIILHRSYKTNHMKSTWWKTHFTNNNYHFFFTNPKHANLQLPTGIYGANIITILSLLCVLFYYIAVLQKKLQKITQIHGELMEKTFWNILIATFLGIIFLNCGKNR